jgi:hypothetical protein
VRLSRSRVLLRAVLLTVGGGFTLWKAVDAFLAAPRVGGSGGVLLQRIAAVEALVALLALGAAVIALLSLRSKRRKHTLVLRDVRPGPPTGEKDSRSSRA